ncbi:MAG: hypothetical protein ACUZ8H_01370 [Candidatus Anammoxibacter sp.]
MSIKTDITANIDAKLTSGLRIPAVTHRGVIKNDTANIVDNFYGTTVTESHLTTNVFTIKKVGDCTYKLNILKQGYKVTVTGTITALKRNLVNVATITLPEYKAITNKEFRGIAMTQGGTLVTGIVISDTLGTTTLKFKNAISLNVTVSFGITYNTNL